MTDRHSRQGFLGPTSECTLASAVVAIVGLGGGGSHIAQQLAHLGIGRFILFDGDRIDHGNLNRTVGATPADAEAALLKVEVATRQIKAIQPTAIVAAYAKPWELCGPAIRSADIIVGCVDTYAGRDNLERLARRFHIPYIDIGMDVHKIEGGHAIAGQVIVSIPDGPCMRCVGFIGEERLANEAAEYGAAGGRPQVVWPNGVLASTAVGLVVQMLLPWQGSARSAIYLEYDGNAHQLRPHPRVTFVLTNSCCHFGGVHALGDPFESPV